MTTGEQEHGSSTTAQIGRGYKRAEPNGTPEGAPDTLSVEASIPLVNTVFATSSAERRAVNVNPQRIVRILQSLEKNRELQSKGLG